MNKLIVAFITMFSANLMAGGIPALDFVGLWGESKLSEAKIDYAEILQVHFPCSVSYKDEESVITVFIVQEMESLKFCREINAIASNNFTTIKVQDKK